MKTNARFLIYPAVIFASILLLSVRGSDLQDLQKAAQATTIIAKFADDMQKLDQKNSQPPQAIEIPQQQQYQAPATPLPDGAYIFKSDTDGFGTQEFDSDPNSKTWTPEIMTLGRIYIATCSDTENGWGIANFPQDLVGVKTHFLSGEKITILMATARHARWRLKLWNEKGDKLSSYETPVGTVATWIGENSKSSLPPGNYTAGFYFLREIGGTEDEVLIKKVNFAVTGDAPTQQVQQVKASLPEGVYDFNDPQLGHVIITTCNFYDNFEGDHHPHAEDFVGLKTHFTAKEKILIEVISQNPTSNWRYKLWDGSSGDLLCDYKMPSTNAPTTEFPLHFSDGTTNSTSNLTHNYTLAFYNGDTFIKKFSFDVTDK